MDVEIRNQNRRLRQSLSLSVPPSLSHLPRPLAILIFAGMVLAALVRAPKRCTGLARTSLMAGVRAGRDPRLAPGGRAGIGGGTPASFSRSSALSLSSGPPAAPTPPTPPKKRWEAGDTVSVRSSGRPGDGRAGKVTAVRGSGWYSVWLFDTEEVVKCRASQLGGSDAAGAGRDGPPGASSDPSDVRAPARRDAASEAVPRDATLFADDPTDAPSARFETTMPATAVGPPMTVLVDPGTPPDHPPPPPPTIHDLDAALLHDKEDQSQNPRDREFLRQLSHHASFEKWAVFTDLHCSPATLDTCLEVLDRVHAVAVQHGAGVLFLGDFWHHRGTLRVDCLNAVLKALKGWTVPMVMIPGNHDQVTLGGHSHGLTPLENAYRVGGVAGPLVLSHPSVFRGALFVPHIRDVATMESILQSGPARAATALFVHAEVRGALMNDLVASTHGIPPSSFPTRRPIYSGHFHKPHRVQAADQHKATVEYLGSPYQISLAEAQQEKQLVVLDSSWRCEKRIALDVGRRHFRASSWDELLRLKLQDDRSSALLESTDSYSLDSVREGDRVVVTVAQGDRRRLSKSDDDGSASSHAITSHIQAFRDHGVALEIREAGSLDPTALAASDHNLSGGPLPEDMSPESTWRAYLEESCALEGTSDDDHREALLEAGLQILEGLEASNGNDGVDSYHGVQLQYDLNLSHISVKGFGPFQRKATYPLGDRGLVLLRGSNSDVGSDSNGSGKSSLAMATLWALTGSMDARPGQDGKVSDVINDDSREARVTVEGSINGRPFVISRSKTASKGNLFFQLDDVDLTTQSVKETQALVEEKLGVDSHILARTIFHGQHVMNDLLEATDTKLKDELSLMVPLGLWQQACSVARAKSRQALKKFDELNGMVRLRTGDVNELTRRATVARDKWDIKRISWEAAKQNLEGEMQDTQISFVEDHEPVSPSGIQTELDRVSDEIQILNHRYESMLKERDSDVQPLELRMAQVQESLATLVLKKNNLERNSLACTMSLQSARRMIDQIEQKWTLDLSLGTPAMLVTPEVCPTCKQPLESGGSHQHHDSLQKNLEAEVDDAVRALKIAQEALQAASHEESECSIALTQTETLVKVISSDLHQLTSKWNEKLSGLHEDLHTKRVSQTELTAQLSASVKVSEQRSRMNSAMAAIGLEGLAVDHAREMFESLEAEVTSATDVLIQLKEENLREKDIAEVMAEVGERFGQRGVQTFVLQNVVGSLQRTSQTYLDQLSDGGQRLELSLEAGDKISRTAFIQGPDGEYKVRPLATLSGGQWRRCSLAMSFAFAELMAKRGRFRSSLLVLDEPLTHLDRSGRTKFGDVVRNLVVSGGWPRSEFGMSTVVVILQDLAAEELEEAFDSIDTVVRQGGDSYVELDG